MLPRDAPLRPKGRKEDLKGIESNIGTSVNSGRGEFLERVMD